jgi:phosphatidate cytidylyltransferase
VSGVTAESSRPDRLPPRGLGAPGFARNLAQRVGTALVALPLVVAALVLGPPWLVLAILVVALGIGLSEFYALVAVRGIRPLRLAGALVAGALFLDVVAPAWLPFPCGPLGVLLLLAAMLQRGLDQDSVGAGAATLLGAAYLGVLGGTIGALLVLEPAAEGGFRIVLLLGILVIADTFAFFVGHAVGRHRLAPSISPGKTIEGALGGLAGGVVGAFLIRQFGLPGLPPLHTLGLGVAVAALGIVGDLEESLLKRWAGAKDSGTLFPGHGGMLDRLDSLLFGAPVLYYYFLYVR